MAVVATAEGEAEVAGQPLLVSSLMSTSIKVTEAARSIITFTTRDGIVMPKFGVIQHKTVQTVNFILMVNRFTSKKIHNPSRARPNNVPSFLELKYTPWDPFHPIKGTGQT